MADEVVYEGRLSDSDALMWSIERDPVLRSTITGAWLLDSSPDWERLRRRTEAASRMIPRLRQRVAANPFSIAPPRWEIDPDFDLDFHLRRVRAPGAGTMRDLLDLAEPIAMGGFDRDRPLWELHLVEGLEDGRSGMIMKLHHSISDGVGLVKMTGRLIERYRTPDPNRPQKPLPPLPEPNYKSFYERTLDALDHEGRRQVGRALGFAGAIGEAARDPLGAARELTETLGSVRRLMAPVSEPLSPVMRERSTRLRLDVLEIPLDRLKAAARKAPGTLNDAFVAAICGGLRRYHEAHDALVEDLRMTMPINLRQGEKGKTAGNQFAPARFLVPIAIVDPVQRMLEIQARVKKQRSEPGLPFMDEISGLLNRFPGAVAAQIVGGMLKGVDFVTSNVPGPQFEVYASGARLERNFGFGPLTGAAANVTLFSYDGVCGVGISTDQAAVPDPELFLDCLREGVDEVLALA